MTFNYVVIEIFSFVHSWKKWEGFRISFFFFFFVGEDGWNFFRDGRAKINRLFMVRKEEENDYTRARRENACD